MHSTGKENFTVFVYFNTKKHIVKNNNDLSDPKDMSSSKRKGAKPKEITPTKPEVDKRKRNQSTEKKRGGKTGRK